MNKKESNIEELTDSIQLLQLRTPKYMLVTLLFAGFLIIGFLVWGYFGTMEESLELYGEMRPANEKIIYSPVTGYVRSINYKDGDIVSEGDVILTYVELNSSQNKYGLKATCNGYLSLNSSIVSGVLLNQGQGIGKIIEDFEHLNIDFMIPEYYIYDIYEGDDMNCVIINHGSTQCEFKDKIDSISIDSEYNEVIGSNCYKARSSIHKEEIKFKTKDENLKIGATVKIRLIQKEERILEWIWKQILHES